MCCHHWVECCLTLVCIVRGMASEPTTSVRHPPSSLSIFTLRSFSVASPSPPPLSPACVAPVRLVQYNVCGWRIGVSVCPGGSSHTLLEGKGHTAWIPPSPSLFKRPFHTLHAYSPSALLDGIVSLRSKPTKAQREMAGTKTGVSGPLGGVSLCLLQTCICSIKLIKYQGYTRSPPMSTQSSILKMCDCSPPLILKRM